MSTVSPGASGNSGPPDLLALGRVEDDWRGVAAEHEAGILLLESEGLVEVRRRDDGEGIDARLSFDGRRLMAAEAHEWE